MVVEARKQVTGFNGVSMPYLLVSIGIYSIVDPDLPGVNMERHDVDDDTAYGDI